MAPGMQRITSAQRKVLPGENSDAEIPDKEERVPSGWHFRSGRTLELLPLPVLREFYFFRECCCGCYDGVEVAWTKIPAVFSFSVLSIEVPQKKSVSRRKRGLTFFSVYSIILLI